MAHQLSGEQLARNAEELKAFLDANGPSSRQQILNGTQWSGWRFDEVVKHRPDWLSVVEIVKRATGYYCIYGSSGEHVLGICEQCGRKKFHPAYKNKTYCFRCGAGVRTPPVIDCFDTTGIDPQSPTEHLPRTEGKMRVLAARFERKMDLWNELDAQDVDTERSPEIADEFDDEDWDED